MTVNVKRAAAEARALRLALALAARVGWTFDRYGPMLPTAFAGYLHIGRAHLLLLPTVAGLDFARRQVEPATRACRSDALVVSLPDDGTPCFAFATWARTATSWMEPLALWLSQAGEPWLVPCGDDGRLGVRLVDALHCAARVPWESDAARRAGLDRAAAWVAELG